MIFEDRSDFWSRLANHPEVKPHLGVGDPTLLDAFVKLPNVRPLRSESGGFLFVGIDAFSQVYELHTLYRPEGWDRREITTAAREACETVFASGAQLIVTYEVAGWRRSQPPKSFGFRPAGEFAGPYRTWILTRAAWDASPARRRM